MKNKTYLTERNIYMVLFLLVVVLLPFASIELLTSYNYMNKIPLALLISSIIACLYAKNPFYLVNKLTKKRESNNAKN